MKKVLSFVLVLALVLSSFSMAFAATSTNKTMFADTKGEACEMPVQVLTGLGVVNGFPDGTYGPEKTVTRAELAKMIMVSLGINEFADKSTTYFSDMVGSEWAAGYVGYAASLGIIKGYPDGRFGPTNPVSYDEAVTMIVRAFGYTESAKEMNGTWPAVYIQKARALGVLDDVTAVGATGATRGDISIMLYNSLDVPHVYVDNDGATQFKTGKATTMMNILNKNGSSAYGIVDSGNADNALVNIRPLVGAAAKIHTNADGDVIAVADVKTTFITGDLSIDNKTLTVGDVDYKISPTTAARVFDPSKADAVKAADLTAISHFENGATGDFKVGSTELIKADTYTLAAKVSGKTLTEVYSVMKWKVSADGQFAKEDATNIEKNKKLFGKEFITDKNDVITNNSFDLVGVDSLNKIAEDNVVYVYADKEGIRKIAVGTEVVSGEITKVKGADADIKITIGGKAYEVAANATIDTLEAGDEVKLILDADGKIYDTKAISGATGNYGVIIQTEAGKAAAANVFEALGKVKLMTSAGEVVNYDVSADTDSTAYLGKTTKAWATEAKSGTIVEYGVDKSGKVDAIKLAKTATLSAGVAGDTTLLTEKGYYKGFYVNTNAPIFTFDGTKTTLIAQGATTRDGGNYGKTTLAKVLDSKIDADIIVKDGKIAAMLVADYSSDADVYGVVSEASKNNSDAKHHINFFINGEAKDFDAKTAAYDAAMLDVKGTNDLFKITFDSAGAVKDLTIEVAKKTVAKDSATTYAGFVLENDGNSYTISREAAVYVVDASNDDRYSVGKANELKAYISDGKAIKGMSLYATDKDADTVYDVIIIQK